MTASARTSPPAGDRSPGRRPLSGKDRLLLIPPALALASMIGLFVFLGSGDLDPTSGDAEGFGPDDVFFLGVVLANTLVPVVVAGLVIITAKFWWRGMPVAAVTSVVFSAAVIGEVVVMLFDDSSTTALVLIFVPVELGLVLLPFVGAVGLVHWLHGRHLVKKG